MWLWRLLRWMSVGRCVAFARSTIAAVLIFSCVGRWNRLQRLEQGRGVAVEDGCPPPLRSSVSCVSAAQTADRTPHIRGPVQGRVVTGRGTRVMAGEPDSWRTVVRTVDSVSSIASIGEARAPVPRCTLHTPAPRRPVSRVPERACCCPLLVLR
jgi:hypothetical protein